MLLLLLKLSYMLHEVRRLRRMLRECCGGRPRHDLASCNGRSTLLSLGDTASRKTPP